MTRTLKKLVVAIFLLAFAGSPPRAVPSPVGDFFQKVGRTISKFRKPTPTPSPQKQTKPRNDGAQLQPTEQISTVLKSPQAAATPTATPFDIRPALLAPPSTKKRDVPYGVAVPNKLGLVTSPYAPDQGYVDVSAFPSSTEVLDPFTGKIFRTP